MTLHINVDIIKQAAKYIENMQNVIKNTGKSGIMRNKNNNVSTSGGVGLFSLCFLVFLVLKLTHVIDWSWWWVTAPLWGGFIIGVFIIVIACIVCILINIFKK